MSQVIEGGTWTGHLGQSIHKMTEIQKSKGSFYMNGRKLDISRNFRDGFTLSYSVQ